MYFGAARQYVMLKLSALFVVLSNMYGASFSISIGHCDSNFSLQIIRTIRAVSKLNNASTLMQRRQKVFKYLGNKNVLVG